MSVELGERHGLTVGDAIVVVALLVFIIGWVAGWVWMVGRASQKNLNGLVDFWLLVLGFGPPLWAGGLVRHIVAGRELRGRQGRSQVRFPNE